MFTISEEDIKKRKEELKFFGFTLFKGLIDKSFLKKMEYEAIKFSWANIGNAEINVIETSEKCVLSSSHNLSSSLKIYSDLYNSAEIRKLYYKLIGNLPNKNEKINSSYFFKANESKEIKIHQDNAYFNLYSGIDCLTFYIPIHYQSKSRGTIFYFSGSHLLGDIEHVPNGNIGASMCILKNPFLKDYKINYLNLEPGDIVIHNALVVHGTLPNPKNYLCEAFNFTLFGEFNKINNLKYQDYKNKLKNFLLKQKRLH